MCVKFIIVSYYDEFIANKDLQQLYYNIYTTFFKSIIYKKYYNIIRAWHTQLTSVSKNGS